VKLTMGEIVREYLPDAGDDEIEHVVYGHTGYPAFWNIPADGATPEECFRKQLATYRDGGGREMTLCCDPEGVSRELEKYRTSTVNPADSNGEGL